MLAYTLDGNNKATITGLGTYNLSSTGGVLTIPATIDIDGYTVVAIGKSAFSQCYSLTSITLPTNLTPIGKVALAYSGLTRITLPASLNTIMLYAFQGCPLTEVIFEGEFKAFYNYNNDVFGPTNSGFNPYAFMSVNTHPNFYATDIAKWSTKETYFYISYNGPKYTMTQLQPSCYNKGTKILCLNKQFEEEYIPIENLRKGDLVKTYKHGYRRVDLIGKNLMKNNPDIFNYCMYKMEKTETNGLLEDLIVTGGHVILVDDLGIYKEQNEKIFGSTPMIDDKYLLLCSLSKDFTKIENTALYTYYHFTLENNGSDDERFGVWANGILTETVSKDQFTDHSYTLL